MCGNKAGEGLISLRRELFLGSSPGLQNRKGREGLKLSNLSVRLPPTPNPDTRTPSLLFNRLTHNPTVSVSPAAPLRWSSAHSLSQCPPGPHPAKPLHFLPVPGCAWPVPRASRGGRRQRAPPRAAARAATPAPRRLVGSWLVGLQVAFPSRQALPALSPSAGRASTSGPCYAGCGLRAAHGGLPGRGAADALRDPFSRNWTATGTAWWTSASCRRGSKAWASPLRSGRRGGGSLRGAARGPEGCRDSGCSRTRRRPAALQEEAGLEAASP